MANSLELHAAETLFVVRDAATTKRLPIPKDWQTLTVSTSSQLSSALERADANRKRVLLIADEEHFEESLTLLRSHTRQTVRSGMIILSENPEAFLEKRNSHAELLDVLPEKILKKNFVFHLLRALRVLLLFEEFGSPRVNQRTLERLNEIFIALSSERNPQRLLATILVKAMELADAQGGLLYMLQETDDGELTFRLCIRHDKENEISFQNVLVRVQETNLCGYVALTGKPLNITNVADLNPMALPQFDPEIDNVHQKTAAVLTIPLKNTRNEIIAILQLSNKRAQSERIGLSSSRKPSNAFLNEDVSLLTSFVTQAAICLENVDLYADIQKLFDGFVKASITAIESRDPSTGGHSERVAKMTVALAIATNDCNEGIYRSVKFKQEEVRELEYAALLHDFGKIGVREEVLIKAKKLYPHQLEAIRERVKICKAAAKIRCLEQRLLKQEPEAQIEREYKQKLADIERDWSLIEAANEPTILKRESIESLDRIRTDELLLPDGSTINLLTEDEFQALSVTMGSLTESERLEIESHVRHTYQFLKMIPWTKDFKHLPEIAYGHHEKLDGTGYPRGLTSHAIPLQSKMMTIADIFDALTAADRWYKESVPTEKAIDILNQEVQQGKIDPVLFDLFVKKKIFDVTGSKPLKKVG